VKSDASVPVQVDGEILSALPAMIKLHPERLQLIFPHDS
jgi:diacylglycerol kinase family enzyme